MKSADITENFNLGHSVKHGFHHTDFHKTNNFSWKEFICIWWRVQIIRRSLI